VAAFFDLSGRVSLSIDDPDRRVERRVAVQMDPFAPVSPPAAEADVVLASVPPESLPPFGDVHNPANDGLRTAADGERLFLLLEGHACAVPDPVDGGTVRFTYGRGFPIGRVVRTVVRPALQLALPSRGAVAVHSAAVELEGRAVLVAGWSESGKTEAALALMETGASFLSDKWTIVGEDGRASAFPVNVGVRRWVTPYLPRLAASLPPAARAQMRVAAVAAGLAAPLPRGGRTGRAAEIADRAVMLADRVALAPRELRAAYDQRDDAGRRVPLGLVAVLTTVPGERVSARPADPEWAAARLARSAAYERRTYFALAERRRYAFPVQAAHPGPAERSADADLRVLRRVLAASRVIEVRAPFPVDPRRIAGALAEWV
jgi:hypothetical protein